jgi:hypothetical protein
LTKNVSRQLFNAAVIGIAASLALAFFILVVLTRDIQLAVMAIISIGGVVVSLICAMVWLGWDLSGWLKLEVKRRERGGDREGDIAAMIFSCLAESWGHDFPTLTHFSFIYDCLPASRACASPEFSGKLGRLHQGVGLY